MLDQFKNIKKTNWLLKILIIGFVTFASCNNSDEASPNSGNLLDGQWVRVDGNNPNANSMKVEISGNSATVLDPASTSLSVGDLKWKEITSVADNKYEHLELGSDGNYYDASITVVNNNTIEILVLASGPGNEQEWDRIP